MSLSPCANAGVCFVLPWLSIAAGLQCAVKQELPEQCKAWATVWLHIFCAGAVVCICAHANHHNHGCMQPHSTCAAAGACVLMLPPGRFLPAAGVPSPECCPHCAAAPLSFRCSIGIPALQLHNVSPAGHAQGSAWPWVRSSRGGVPSEALVAN